METTQKSSVAFLGILSFLYEKDIVESVRRGSLWIYLAWHDIVTRYRRTMLGPFWLVLSTAISIIALGFVGAMLFNQKLESFFPYVAAGIISWNFMCTFIIEGCNTFIVNAPLIQNIRVPLFSFCLRLVMRTFIIFFHMLVILIFINIYFKVPLTRATLLVFPAFLLFFLNGLSVSLYFGFLCARFRDFQQIILSLLNVIFFATPIMWRIESIAHQYHYLIKMNPFVHFLDVLRSPFLGEYPSSYSLKFVCIITFLNLMIAFAVFKRYHHRLAYWV